MILEKMKNIRLILGDEEINKMSYSNQLKCLVGGLTYFSENAEMLMDMQAHILALFYKHLKKKYPKMSGKQLVKMAGNLFSENKVSTKTNESIKKLVIQEYRKFFINALLKSAQKNESSNDELHISAIDNKIDTEIEKSYDTLIIKWVGVALLFLLGFFLMEM